MTSDIFLIGMHRDGDGYRASDNEITRAQIKTVKEYPLGIVDPNGEVFEWINFDDPNEPRTIFQTIVRDRSRRIDQHLIMADRPPFVAVTIEDGKVIRFEFYEGHDALRLVYDFRSPVLKDADLPPFHEED